MKGTDSHTNIWSVGFRKADDGVMKVFLFANERILRAGEVQKELFQHLTQRGVEAIDISAMPPHATNGLIREDDVVISIGGDGSLLQLLHRIGIPRAPIFGVNLGTLGFLADIAVSSLLEGVEALISGKYKVTERLVVEGSIANRQLGFAVNEVAIHRGCYPHIVDLAVHVDGVFVNAFSADGIIIATPSGSTAYSLSAGGPIITPEVQALILTPICPHAISNRPIVLAPHHTLSIELCRGGESVDIALDGQPPKLLKKNEVLEIKKSDAPFLLASPASSDYFCTLRTKLGWAGSLRR